MKSIKCNDLDELTRFSNNSNGLTPALSQGINFKKYQKKNNNKYDNTFIEGFEGEVAEVVSTDDPTYKNETSENKLTTQSNEIIAENTQNIEYHKSLDELRSEYDTSLKQYQDLMAKIDNKTQNYLKRTKNNPYLGKNIRFTTGHVCYVTQQGVIKWIPNPQIWDSLENKNGCPGKTFTDVDLKYPSQDTPGTSIPELNLVMGPHMRQGESCGNAGKNVYVNTLLNDPKEKYIGCYNDKAPTTEIQFVPVMTSNTSSGFSTTASSVYQNNNPVWGPWAAFNRKDDPYWHSLWSPSTNYNAKTGVYQGNNEMWYWDRDDYYGSKSKGILSSKGEWLWLEYGPGFTLTKYELRGRQGCCGSINGRTPNSWVVIGGVYNLGWFLVDQRDNTYSVNDGKNGYETRTFYVKNPKHYNIYALITTNVGHPGNRENYRDCVQIAQWNLFTTSDYGTNNQNNNTPAMKSEKFIGRADFNTCKKYASENGFKYFGMQDGNSENANCVLSNDLASTKKYGIGYAYKQLPLWHSNTTGKGSVAFLNNQGLLVVNNFSNAAVWSSSDGSGLPGNYLGCYGDCSLGRGLPNYLGWSTYDTCKTSAKNGNWKYFGLQFTQPNGQSECWVGNDMNRAISMGKAGNCTKLNNIDVGGSCSNAVYNTNEGAINSFLILQDDGNMCIYRGTNPNDNQGFLFQSGSNGRQKDKNINFSAARSKFGKNWIPNGTTLAIGDFVGSNDGSIYLIMQSDGNLVLFGSERTEGCSAKLSGKQVGGSFINAVYEFATSGFKENIGKLAFVDENDLLHEYNSGNAQFNNTYTKVDKYDAYGSDIPGAAYAGATKDQCQSTCDKNKDCYGYVFDFQHNVCYPKSSGMWPYGGESRPLSHVDTYIKNKIPLSIPLGATNETMNIDSAQYQFYNKGGVPPKQYGLMNATEIEKAELERLELKMKNQSNEITKLINTSSTGTNTSENQADKNLQGLNTYDIEMKKTTDEINTLNSTNESFMNYGYTANNNINKILQDSDIGVLQKNYEYLLWTILATGSVLIAMNITKN